MLSRDRFMGCRVPADLPVDVVAIKLTRVKEMLHFVLAPHWPNFAISEERLETAERRGDRRETFVVRAKGWAVFQVDSSGFGNGWLLSCRHIGAARRCIKQM